MTKPPKPPPVWLHVQPLPRDDDPDGNRRLRLVLKRMLRAYGLVLVGLRTTNPSKPPDAS